MKELTPKKIVAELDKYIIGQDMAKKCVAIAIRNRWRRQQLGPEMRDEVTPKNIIMIGPTGVGKTEIARRLANLINAPFIKVEASKYTEVGYHGRDVDSMVRDLVEVSMNMRRREALEEVAAKAKTHAEERLLDLLLPRPSSQRARVSSTQSVEAETTVEPRPEETREKLRAKLRAGAMEKRFVELKIDEKMVPMMQVFSSAGFEEYGLDLQSMMGNLFPSKPVTKKVTVAEARKILLQQESEKLVDKEKMIREALSRTENAGVIFVDELDKVTSKERSYGPDVSREGVQRDMLPIIEGSTVPTRYGLVRTHHILFIAAGAFHIAKPSDLIPELQGRFPIRVELNNLTKDDFVRILTEPKNALVKQYQALLKTEKVRIDFDQKSIEEIAAVAAQVNTTMQNIGARRLQTVMEKLLEDISFDAPDLKTRTVKIDKKYVRDKLKSIVQDEDLSRYIL